MAAIGMYLHAAFHPVVRIGLGRKVAQRAIAPSSCPDMGQEEADAQVDGLHPRLLKDQSPCLRQGCFRFR